MGPIKRLLLVSVMFLIFVPTLLAETNVRIYAKDITTNEIISSMPVVFNARNLNLNIIEKSTEHLDENGIFIYALRPGNWEVQISLFDAATDEIDYYSERALYIQKDEPFLNKTFYFSPVGAIEGVVKDKNGNLVSFAELDFKCSKEIRAETPDKTTNFGSFKAMLMPVGKCKVFTAFQNLVGVEEVEVRKGESVIVEVALEGSLTSEKQSMPLNWIIYGLIVLVVAIALASFILMRRRIKKDIKKSISKEVKKQARKTRKKKPKEKPKESNEEAKETINPRARDIIKTLNEKEEKVVNFLFESNNQTTQAKIRNNTGIPKTSLARILQKLEAKKIIEIERIGKLKKIRFTDWFMGKD